MQEFYIPHKLSVGDTTNLSDKDSKLITDNRRLKVESLIHISSPKALFLAQIVYMDKGTVEVEILEVITEITRRARIDEITIIQSLSNDSKYNYFLEKAVELGVERIIPVESTYSLLNIKKAKKKIGLWNAILKQAQEQSRNPNLPEIHEPTKLADLNNLKSKSDYNLCLATEDVGAISLKAYLEKIEGQRSYTIAIGPERGWSGEDLKIFKELKFDFVSMGDIILRTETAPLAITSILNFKNGRY